MSGPDSQSVASDVSEPVLLSVALFRTPLISTQHDSPR